MQIVSVNVGKKTQLNIGNKTVATGLFKHPVDWPVQVGKLGIDGDTIVGTNVHGGEDQAVYLYSLADYHWWSETLGRELEPATFGENFTISSFPDQPLRIGDRLTINNIVVLEITAPRIPCAKLATRMEDRKFGEQFVKAMRPGAYARVLSPGEVKAGDVIVWQQTEEDFVYNNDFFREWNQKDWSIAFFQQALRSPISKIARRTIQKRLSL